MTRIVQLTDRHRTLALQARKFRQVLHDERCRPILERVAQHYSGRLSSAVKLLAADGIPAPGGKRWHRKAVWLIAKRHNMRGKDTADQMALVANGMEGKQLKYKELVA